eukprot:CAMPEP_0206542958 /NCGR_PEP_ID=MMETSP0325_2-20121206/10516_1 /ASSEMBLY_ACC=CAM_ASM_000347 /TAXON_ID=2866 /ORGANISM="Crypthecodinium cohnii, Strain Seligo" /LENGTH=36 /DNA_ID= /DNA_START= /DNA_END= /DNA_ORIENTATION=
MAAVCPAFGGVAAPLARHVPRVLFRPLVGSCARGAR